ncbi:MAG: SMI1/KNR4 family protein [Flavobacteriales bacterium]|nr:SMI1/KNR4 family protein [Flavobacteriales bacterium]
MVSQLKEMVQKLKNDGMFINHFHILPADLEAIKKVEDALGYRLDESITSFYSECGGVQLIWTHKENLEFEDLAQVLNSNKALKSNWAFLDYYNYDGVIMIPSIKEVFLTDWKKMIYWDDTEGEVEFAGKTYQEPDFSKQLKPFDWFSNYYDVTFFLDKNSNPCLIMGDDHMACYTDSRRITVSVYLEFLLKTRGAINARPSLFSKYAGHKYPVITQNDIEKLPEIDFGKYMGEDGIEIPFGENFWSD